MIRLRFPLYALSILACGSAPATGFLIMQPGPSTQPDSETDLTTGVRKWSEFAMTHSTRGAVLSVMPPIGGNVDAGIANYESAAASASDALFPAAEAWRLALREMPSLPLYGPDHFHLGQHGAWLSALVITAMTYNRPPADFPNLFPEVISSAQEAVMRRAATAAIAASGRR